MAAPVRNHDGRPLPRNMMRLPCLLAAMFALANVSAFAADQKKDEPKKEAKKES